MSIVLRQPKGLKNRLNYLEVRSINQVEVSAMLVVGSLTPIKAR